MVVQCSRMLANIKHNITVINEHLFDVYENSSKCEKRLCLAWKMTNVCVWLGGDNHMRWRVIVFNTFNCSWMLRIISILGDINWSNYASGHKTNLLCGVHNHHHYNAQNLLYSPQPKLPITQVWIFFSLRHSNTDNKVLTFFQILFLKTFQDHICKYSRYKMCQLCIKLDPYDLQCQCNCQFCEHFHLYIILIFHLVFIDFNTTAKSFQLTGA